MKQSELTKKIKKIHKLFDQLETEFNSLPSGMQDIILNQHSENYSINHCTRWGLTASEELLRDSKKLFKLYNKNY